MSFLYELEKFLRSCAFFTHHIIWIFIHIIEYVIHPLYFPIFGKPLEKYLGKYVNYWITSKFATTFLDVVNIKAVALGLVFF